MIDISSEKITEIASKVFPHLRDCLFYINEQDGYVLFGKYTINQSGSVIRHRDERIFHFNSVRNATVWCILDHNNKFYEATRVLELDSKIVSTGIDKEIHSRLKKRGDVEMRIINSAKLQSDHDRERLFHSEMNKYIIMARDCQQRRFEHETNRTGRKQKN